MIYERILKIAKAKGISIRSIERRAGLSNGTIRKWKEASPTVDNISAVAKVLGVAVMNLLEDKENQEEITMPR